MEDAHARAQALAERMDAPAATSWRPDDPAENHPKMLVGELVGCEIGHTRGWGPKQIAILRDVEGVLWNVWLLHTVLQGEFERKQPAIGEWLAVRYEGKVVPERGAPYEKYTLVVDRQAGSKPVWGAGAPQPEQAEQPPPFAGVEPERQQPPAPPVVQADVCDQCGFASGKHANGCPRALDDDIPF